MAAADRVGFEHEPHGGLEHLAVQRDRAPFLEADADDFWLDDEVFAPEWRAHDGFDDLHTCIEMFEVFGLVRRAQYVRVGRVGFLDAHLVSEAGLAHVLRHLLAAAQLVDERLVEPWLVDPQPGVGEQTVAIEALDVVALEGAPIAPDVHVVFFHGKYEHRARDRPADGRGVEVRDAGRGNVERSALKHRKPFAHELRAAVDQAGVFGAVQRGASRNLVVVLFIRLAEVCGVGVGNGPVLPHPVKGGAGVQTAGKRNPDFFAGGKVLKNGRHL